MKPSPEEASRILSDVRPEKCFWVNNGPLLHNIYELSLSLSTMKPETFLCHVNSEKNDFSNWAADVLRDNEFAKRIRRMRKQEDVLRAVRKRVEELEKACAR